MFGTFCYIVIKFVSHGCHVFLFCVFSYYMCCTFLPYVCEFRSFRETMPYVFGQSPTRTASPAGRALPWFIPCLYHRNNGVRSNTCLYPKASRK